MTKITSCVLWSVAVLAIASPASAKGKHITCPFTGVTTEGTKSTSIERTMNFYLDDTYERLVGEGDDLNVVHTETYSDTRVDAQISTAPVAGGMMFFGRATSERAWLSINRLTGAAAYAVKLFPRGAEVARATCREVEQPPAKF
jgi:hypothetical protein